MATVLFVVKATITKKREAAFNAWYDDTHCPQFLRYPGAVSARRYRAIMGEDRYRYMAVYEMRDEKTFRAFMRSRHFRDLKREYDRRFGKVSERARFAYTQVFP
jgi:antibiotic biosynthesis monooxygenase (ABM) superfamily enzyme